MICAVWMAVTCCQGAAAVIACLAVPGPMCLTVATAMTACAAVHTVDGWGDDDTIAGGFGADSLNGGEGADLLRGGDDNDTLGGGSGHDSLYGGAGDDEIDGGDGDDLLVAGGGTDVLNGGAGNDVLWGAAGSMLSGGSGADDFMIGDGGPSVVTDFDGSVDRLVVVYDATLHPSPLITVDDMGSDALIRLDGVQIASISGGAGLNAADVVLQSA